VDGKPQNWLGDNHADDRGVTCIVTANTVDPGWPLVHHPPPTHHATTEPLSSELLGLLSKVPLVSGG
jgi:hypothetical protein